MEWFAELPAVVRFLLPLVPAVLVAVYIGLPVYMRFKPAVLPPPGSCRVNSLPQVQDPARLARVHQALVAPSGAQPEALVDDVKSYVSYDPHPGEESSPHSGLVFRKADGTLRPTWKGAFAFAWGWLWPFSLVRRARASRAAAALLADLGV